MSQLPISEAELHAYVDGILPESRRLEIEAFLAEQPDEAKRIAGYKQQNARLRALFNPILDEPIPPRLARIKSRIDPVLRWHLQRYAAVCIIALWAQRQVGYCMIKRIRPRALSTSRAVLPLRQTPVSRWRNKQRSLIASTARKCAIRSSSARIRKSTWWRGCPKDSACRSGCRNWASWVSS